ncbi:sphingomyelin phosphodiesterase [Janthinobacterium fluminis]|uniref:Sphingomyelin phosphodiesterase n=1 Tax=Janthinobacterium fluminis TaxID=2987524 RepID=A0ABT5JW03_9BURK|nr:sphingomyelin phosphodiesterase [Janthinobacterium fluminis]MDC8756909.1 sphingomyelin phosphodiesterase [Janthinobacterium fluminis]
MAETDHRLRLVTMNVQLMTQDAIFNQDAVNKRADIIADAFLNRPWPDVICLNEMFDDEARGRIKDKLSAIWPHIHEKFGPTRSLDFTDKYTVIGSIIAGLKAGNPLLALPFDIAVTKIAAKLELPVNSGLMVLSRYPIKDAIFVSYADYAEDDRLADKGVALVKIARADKCIYNILATHMQAAYEHMDDHADVRRVQLRQIKQLIDDKATKDFVTDARAATIVCGDLNIQGALPSRQEWDDVFANGSSVPFFTTTTRDAWPLFMAPGKWGLNDPCITNREIQKGRASRLDYVLLKDPADPMLEPVERPRFAVHRMFLVNPGLSDHIGLAAEINLFNEHCSPAGALDITDRIGQFNQSLDNGGMVWLHLSGRGSWSLTSDAATFFEVYLPENLSQVLGSQYMTDLRNIDHAAGAWKHGDEPRLSPRASTFVLPVDSFFVRAFRRDDRPGPVSFGYYRHLGTSPYDSIGLNPQTDAVGLDWVALATISVNPPMEFWFNARVRAAASGVAHHSRFELINPAKHDLKLRIVHRSDPGSAVGEVEWGRTSGSDVLLEVGADQPGDQFAYIQVTRNQPTQEGFSARWFTTLNFLVYDYGEPPTLVCVDESGLDIAGGDEIELSMRPDAFGGEVVLLALREDVDRGEEVTLPGPGHNEWASLDTGYVSQLEITIREDEFADDDMETSFFPPLPDAVGSSSFQIMLEPGTGEYRLKVKVAREPE